MSAYAESEALHGRVRAMIRGFERGEPMPESFDSLAADLALFQAVRVPGYAQLCAVRGVAPASIVRACQAPAVPVDAFAVARVFAFDEREASRTFRTSGTTTGVRGVHRMRDVRTYDAAAVAFGRSMLARDLREPVPVIVLGPSDEEVPDSSLAHMGAVFVRALGASEPPERTFFVRDGGLLDAKGLRDRVASLAPRPPAILLATSFALVHLLDELKGEPLSLPAGSRVMQTGGFKGRSREVSPGELRLAIARAFAIDPGAVVSEYGMTELSSQFWEATLVDHRAHAGVFVEPPWARVVAVDPETFAPLPDGAVGIARIEDLANVDSAFAVLASDRVRRVAGGFELMGREADAPPRGCSIGIDEIVSARGGPR
jgi:hypothetical protein